MGFLLVYILVVAVISLVVASMVHRKQVKAGNDPWAWTISAFILSAGLLVVVSYLVLVYMFSFER